MTANPTVQDLLNSLADTDRTIAATRERRDNLTAQLAENITARAQLIMAIRKALPDGVLPGTHVSSPSLIALSDATAGVKVRR